MTFESRARLTVAVCVLALTSAAALAGDAGPPAFPGSTLRLRATLNSQTKNLAIATVRSPATRAMVAAIVDCLLEQVGDVQIQRYRHADDKGPPLEDVLRYYREWASGRGMNQVGRYVMRSEPVKGKPPVVDGVAELHLALGQNGGMLGCLAEPGQVTLVWADGDLAIGPLLAAWLGLPELPNALPQPGEGDVEPKLPSLPDGLPMDRLIARLDLSSRELLPLARELAAHAAAAQPPAGQPPGDAGISPATLMLLSRGPDALKSVHGLTVLLFDAPDDAARSAVSQPAVTWATAKGWGSLVQLGPESGSVQLLANLSDAGGAMVLGQVGDYYGVLVTEGAPDLAVLLGGSP